MTVWTLPPEPTAAMVWDRDGQPWRSDRGWWWPTGGAGRPRTWPELLTRGPITDEEPATADEAGWQQTADRIGVPIHDYEPKEAP